MQNKRRLVLTQRHISDFLQTHEDNAKSPSNLHRAEKQMLTQRGTGSEACTISAHAPTASMAKREVPGAPMENSCTTWGSQA